MNDRRHSEQPDDPEINDLEDALCVFLRYGLCHTLEEQQRTARDYFGILLERRTAVFSTPIDAISLLRDGATFIKSPLERAPDFCRPVMEVWRAHQESGTEPPFIGFCLDKRVKEFLEGWRAAWRLPDWMDDQALERMLALAFPERTQSFVDETRHFVERAKRIGYQLTLSTQGSSVPDAISQARELLAQLEAEERNRPRARGSVRKVFGHIIEFHFEGRNWNQIAKTERDSYSNVKTQALKAAALLPWPLEN